MRAKKKSPSPVGTTQAAENGQLIGNRMKSLRRARKMTLDGLATKTGLNKGYLSRIERGEKSPSVATVIKIAESLAVPVGMLFGEQTDYSEIHLVRAKSRRMVKSKSETGSYPFAALSKAEGNHRIAAFIMLPPREFDPEGFINHSGEEALFVLQGKIEVGFADRSVAMQEGDYLQFPGHLQHRVRRLNSSAQVLIVVSLD